MKIITSPVKKFPGTVTLSDPLNFLQSQAFRKSILDAKDTDWQADEVGYCLAYLPGVLACVDKFAIDGLPEILTIETFPATPRVSAFKFISWLIGEISRLYAESDDPDEKKE